MRTERRLLVISRQSCISGQSGNGEYLYDMLQYLSKHFECITVFLMSNNCALPARVCIPARCPSNLHFHLLGGLRIGNTLFSPIAKLYSLLPVWFVQAFCKKYLAKKELREAKRLLLKIKPAALVANYCWTVPLVTTVRELMPIPIVVITHDVWYKRLMAFKARGINTVWGRGIDAEKEGAMLSLSDLILAITPHDAKEFRALAPEVKVITTPKAGRIRLRNNELTDPVCLFVGSDNFANLDAMQWFLDQVWPIVIKRLPCATFEVCGSVSHKLLFTGVPPSVKLLGVVPDLTPHYKKSRVVVAPLRLGSGLKIKVIEAMEHSRPVVSSTVGGQGLEHLSNRGLCICDEVHEFAFHVIRYLSNPREAIRVGKLLGNIIDSEWSPELSYAPLLNELINLERRRA